jgi:hypothetical protein
MTLIGYTTMCGQRASTNQAWRWTTSLSLPLTIGSTRSMPRWPGLNSGLGRPQEAAAHARAVLEGVDGLHGLGAALLEARCRPSGRHHILFIPHIPRRGDTADVRSTVWSNKIAPTTREPSNPRAGQHTIRMAWTRSSISAS